MHAVLSGESFNGSIHPLPLSVTYQNLISLLLPNKVACMPIPPIRTQLPWMCWCHRYNRGGVHCLHHIIFLSSGLPDHWNIIVHAWTCFQLPRVETWFPRLPWQVASGLSMHTLPNAPTRRPFALPRHWWRKIASYSPIFETPEALFSDKGINHLSHMKMQCAFFCVKKYHSLPYNTMWRNIGKV